MPFQTYEQDIIPIAHHQFFRNARFAESQMRMHDNKKEIFKTINVQVDMYPELVQDLNSDKGTTNEELADAFGTYMRDRFLLAVMAEASKRELAWADGEKTSTVDENGDVTTSLADETSPVYEKVEGLFAPIG